MSSVLPRCSKKQFESKRYLGKKTTVGLFLSQNCVSMKYPGYYNFLAFVEENHIKSPYHCYGCRFFH